MDYETIVRRAAEVPDGSKRCRICERVRPVSFFAPQGSRYTKPYCKPCYKVYQVWWRRIDREEGRSLTVVEFRDQILPVLVDAGEAPWLDETVAEALPEQEPYPYEQLTEEEGLARQEVIYQEMLRTLPSSSDGQPTS